MDNNENSDNSIKNYQDNYLEQYVEDIFKALVDIIIPRTPNLAKLYGEKMFYGALDLLTYKYIILTLSDYYKPLAEATAVMLDIIAERFTSIEENKEQLNTSLSGNGIFTSLSAKDRLRVLNLLKSLDFNYEDLPKIFQESPTFILEISNSLNRLTMMGYYSEWYGYGTTRLDPPNQRKFEFAPLSWEQIGYPGPSFSYRNEVIEYYKRKKVNEL